MKKEVYYIYHIPGKKIGVTTNIQRRVIDMQGYKKGEFEILAQSTNKEHISSLEFDYQRSFGYPTDRQSYAQATERRPYAGDEPNITDQTVTFPCAPSKLYEWMKPRLPLTISLPGEPNDAIITEDNFFSIRQHTQVSQWRENRCYIYNKKLSQLTEPVEEDILDIEVKYDYACCNEKNIFDDIRLWAFERGIFNKGDVKTQYVKLQEESGEVARAIIKGDSAELKDGIGDMVVVLTNLAHLAGFEIEDCIQSAYDVINKRQGKMVNGSFVKNETL